MNNETFIYFQYQHDILGIDINQFDKRSIYELKILIKSGNTLEYENGFKFEDFSFENVSQDRIELYYRDQLLQDQVIINHNNFEDGGRIFINVKRNDYNTNARIELKKRQLENELENIRRELEILNEQIGEVVDLRYIQQSPKSPTYEGSVREYSPEYPESPINYRPTYSESPIYVPSSPIYVPSSPKYQENNINMPELEDWS